MVPFVDLFKQYQSIKNEIHAAIDHVLQSSEYVLGPQLRLFEKAFASYCGRKFTVGLNSGTDALYLALKALGISEGDEVITTANSYIASTLAITINGATPVFVDIDKETYNMDITRIEEKITIKTKAILPIHLFGQPADMKQIAKIAEEHQLAVVEDACQAHGSFHHGKKVPYTSIGCFSFYPGKNLGAYGDGGAVVTDDAKLAATLQKLRNHGSIKKYYHDTEGINSRLDELQAAILTVKLMHLDSWNARRQKHAELYNSHLKNVDIPVVRSYNQSNYHLYVIRSKYRDKIQKALGKNHIMSQIHYPIPIHKQKAYPSFNRLSLPITEKYACEILSLPMFPELTAGEIENICKIVNANAS